MTIHQSREKGLVVYGLQDQKIDNVFPLIFLNKKKANFRKICRFYF